MVQIGAQLCGSGQPTMRAFRCQGGCLHRTATTIVMNIALILNIITLITTTTNGLNVVVAIVIASIEVVLLLGPICVAVFLTVRGVCRGARWGAGGARSWLLCPALCD